MEQLLFDIFGMEGTPKDGQFQVGQFQDGQFQVQLRGAGLPQGRPVSGPRSSTGQRSKNGEIVVECGSDSGPARPMEKFVQHRPNAGQKTRDLSNNGQTGQITLAKLVKIVGPPRECGSGRSPFSGVWG